MSNGKWLTTDDFDPDSVQSIAGLSTTKDKQSQLQQQLILANALRRGSSTPKGQMAGDVYIPPNPLETAMSLYDHFQGIKEGRQGAKDQAALNQQHQDAVDKYFQAYQRSRNPAVAPTATSESDVPDIHSLMGWGQDEQ